MELHAAAQPAEGEPEERPADAPHPSQMPATAVAVGSHYQGLLAAEGDLRVEGVLEGEVVAFGTLWIAEGGRVDAKVEAESIYIAGDFSGEAAARDRIELLPSARVEGPLRAPQVVLQEGCFMCGPCRTGPFADEPEERPLSPLSSP